MIPKPQEPTTQTPWENSQQRAATAVKKNETHFKYDFIKLTLR